MAHLRLLINADSVFLSIHHLSMSMYVFIGQLKYDKFKKYLKGYLYI